MREKGFAVESVCAVLREQGCQIAARTYRAWRQARPPAARTVSDAHIIEALRATAGQPESLYGRRKMTAHLRRRGLPVAHCTVDRLMRAEGMNGVVRAKNVRTTVPGKDGRRAGDLLDRNFTAPAPNLVWIADFTYVRTWAGFVYVAFAVDVFSQMIVGWHAMSSKHTELVLTCLRMATWRRGHDGHPVAAGLVHHSDAGSQAIHLDPLHRAPGAGVHRPLDRQRRRRLRQRADGIGDRPLQDRMHPPRTLPLRAAAHPGRRRVRHGDLGGVVEQRSAARHPRPRSTGRARSGLLRCDHRAPTGAAARVKPAENP